MDFEKVFFVEMVGTGLFVFSVCMIKYSNTSRFVSDDPMLKVGFAMVMFSAAILSCAPLTGGCVNPAVGLAQVFIATKRLPAN
jgi:glycerol uptake facilitator-like aquaporin